MDNAAMSLREVLRIHPENAEAHNNMGVIFLRSGRIEDALRHFRLALIAAPGHPAAEKNIQHLMAHTSKG
jgi:Flp pilus assembly protein TadD